MKKIPIYEEVTYVLGLIFLSLGTALTQISDFGLSMIVAPAYILHVKVSQCLSFFSFGMSGYVLQFFILIILCLILRKFKPIYLMSFCTAVIKGFILDGCLMITKDFPIGEMWERIIYFVLGIIVCAIGVAFLLKTYIAPEVCDLFVKEITKNFNFKINKVKTIYDCSSLVFAIVLSVIFFGLQKPIGMGVGTVICALINGTLITMFIKLFDRIFDYKRLIKFRKDRHEESKLK